MSYNNFKDPVGLAKRMLTSGNRAAYFTLLREGLGVALKPIDALWQKAERKKLAQPAEAEPPMIIILGGSRSGTTLLYQTLAHYLPVSYFNNLSVSFPRSPISSSRFFRSWFRQGKGEKAFQNYYGSAAGFNGPNDGFHIWNRWLGEDRNAIPKELPETVVAEMQTFFRTWYQHMGQPFLNKNNRNSLCVELFLKAFPKVHFVEIRRNPIYVIQSLIQSREAVQGSKYVGWGLGTKEESDEQSYIRDITQQVYGVAQQLNQARSLVPTSQYTYLHYEAFCARPHRVVEEVYHQVWQKDPDQLKLPSLTAYPHTNHQKLADAEFGEIIRQVQDIYGSAYVERWPATVQPQIQS